MKERCEKHTNTQSFGFHCVLVTLYSVEDLGQHYSKQWLVACSEPRHYLNHSWLTVNWILMNKSNLNLNQNNNFLYEKKCIWKCHLQNGCHFSRPQCVDIHYHTLLPFRPRLAARVPIVYRPSWSGEFSSECDKLANDPAERILLVSIRACRLTDDIAGRSWPYE